MRVLRLTDYNVWKQIAATQGFRVWHVVDGSESCVAWTGNGSTLCRIKVAEENVADYRQAFPGAVVVKSEDEVIARATGLL